MNKYHLVQKYFYYFFFGCLNINFYYMSWTAKSRDVSLRHCPTKNNKIQNIVSVASQKLANYFEEVSSR